MDHDTRTALIKKVDAAVHDASRLFGKNWGEKVLLVFKYPYKMLQRKIIVGLYGQGQTFVLKTRTFFGAPMYVTNYDPYLWFCGTFIAPAEVRLTKYLIKHARSEGEVFFDVGAHHGFYTLLVNTLTQGNAQIHTFEPTKLHFKVLSKNTKDHQNIRAVNAAVYSADGTITFFENDRTVSTANRTIATEAAGSKVIYKEVKATALTLDTYCRINTLKPTFLKIDVEGVEAEVLKGASEILHTYHPDIALESWGEVGRTEGPEKILHDTGYKPYRITDMGDLVAMRGAAVDNITEHDFDNLIFKYEA